MGRSSVCSIVMSQLFTVGHSNHPIAHFLALLQQHRIAALADVRSVPYSRRHPQFSRGPLAQCLAAAGIDYLFLGDELGARPKDSACFVDGQVDYDRIAARPAFAAGLARVRAEAGARKVALMCAEREPLDCHRCLLVSPALAARGHSIGHILSDGSIEPHAETEERLLALVHNDADLFANRGERIAAAYRRRAGTAAFRRT